MRNAEIFRKTNETEIRLRLELDGKGNCAADSGCGFLDHMLTAFSKHAGFDLELTCRGDKQVDDHHSVEDIGIVLGQAFKEALGEMKGIGRYGSIILPMDEALILSAVDLSGRAYLGYEVRIPTEKVGSFDTELVKEFWLGFVRSAGCTLHLRQLSGDNSHHIIEAVFKSAARSLKQAVAADAAAADAVPSTKGVMG